MELSVFLEKREPKGTSSYDAQELSYGPVMHNIKILRVVPLRFVWTTKWKWMRVVVGS